MVPFVFGLIVGFWFCFVLFFLSSPAMEPERSQDKCFSFISLSCRYLETIKKCTFLFSLFFWRPPVTMPRVRLLEQMEKACEATLGNHSSRNGVCVSRVLQQQELPKGAFYTVLHTPHMSPVRPWTLGRSWYLLIWHLLLETPYFLPWGQWDFFTS